MDFNFKTPGVKIGNASDEEIVVLFDSQEKVFPPGEIVELEGHIDFTRKDGGAPIFDIEGNVDKRGKEYLRSTPVPKKGASSADIAKHCLEQKGPLGLYFVTGNEEVDEAARKTARAVGKKNRLQTAERTMAEWRQICRRASADGTPIPPMPDNVARADVFLLRNAEEVKAAIKRYQIKLDGASYNTLQECKEHIFARPQYTEHRSTWNSQVIDRFGDDDLLKEPVKESPEEPKKSKK